MRFRFSFFFGILLIALAAGAHAVDEDPARRADWDQRLAFAKEKQAKAKADRGAADALLEAEQKTCYKKFLVTDCQNASRLRHAAAAKKARMLDNEGAKEERQIRKEIRDDKDARRAADAPRRAAELRDKERMIAAQRAKDAAERAQHRANKERQAQEGQARRASDAERVRKKQEDHQRKVDQQLEKAARRDAEREAKASKPNKPEPSTP